MTGKQFDVAIWRLRDLYFAGYLTKTEMEARRDKLLHEWYKTKKSF